MIAGARASAMRFKSTIFDRKFAFAVMCAGLGAAVFSYVEFPLPMLLGPMAACLVASLAGIPMASDRNLGILMRTILGVAFGASITPELVGRVPEIMISLFFVPLFVIAMGCVGYPYFRRIVGFDQKTSYYSAMPGGMQEMVLFGEDEGVNVRAVSLVHATRLVMVFAFVPIVATHYFGLNLDRPPGAPAASLPWHEIAIMIISGVVGWRIALAMRIPGSSIIGPMILTAILSLSGIVNSRPPFEMMLVAQFFIGLGLGVRYSGISPRELRSIVVAGLGYCVLALLTCFALILAIRDFLDAEYIDVLLAFLPGGQAEMAMIALIAGTDVAYVVSHHLLRVFIVIAFAKLVAGFLKLRD